MMAAILDHLWQSTLLALGVGLLALAFRKAGPAVRYGLWFTASAKFLLPFAVLAALGGWLAPGGRPPVQAAPEAVFIAQAATPFSQYATASAIHAAAPVAHAAPGFDPSMILLVAWALGCGAVLIAWMVRWGRVRSAVRSATPLPWRAPMPVRASSSLLEPGLVGLWRPVLIVPQSLPDHLAQPQIDAIVAHEACHLRRKDNLTAAIHMLVEALFWFHPLVWWIGARQGNGVAERITRRTLAQRTIQATRTAPQPRAQARARIVDGSNPGAVAYDCEKGCVACAMKTASGAGGTGGRPAGASHLPSAASAAKGIRNFIEATNHSPWRTAGPPLRSARISSPTLSARRVDCHRWSRMAAIITAAPSCRS